MFSTTTKDNTTNLSIEKLQTIQQTLIHQATIQVTQIIQQIQIHQLTTQITQLIHNKTI